ncbi:MAG: aminotransferase class V-fold PLP-dependent enzyme [Pirellulaceae bacterium]
MSVPPFDDESAWSCWQNEWSIRDDTIYLNHGSFGPPPNMVRAARQAWQLRLDCQPMDFYMRRFEAHWLTTRSQLATFVGTSPENLVFVENATMGMNLVAANFPLTAGDQVVLTDHEYGAVRRIWDRACRRAGADPPIIARLPERFETYEEVVDAIFAVVTSRTRLLVVSHITSPTALILPVQLLCGEARRRGVAICIDGPHAPAQIPINLDALDCDFYAASCHKWLSAPLGSGFLAVHRHYHGHFEPVMLSWGRLLPNVPEHWFEEFLWSGTRDPSGYLSISDAIRFLQQVGEASFRERTHALAQHARQQITALTGLEPPLEDSPRWYGSMALAPLPPCDAKRLQRDLWQQHGLEVPIIDFGGKQYVRVSCHLYNTPAHIAALVTGLQKHLHL